MTNEDIRVYCLSKPCVTEDLPFDDVTLVFKVCGKIFVLLSLDDKPGINLKCDPERAIELREQYNAITPGYHMNKKHWNTIIPDGSISKDLLYELIDHSYMLVAMSLPRIEKAKIGL